MNDALFAQVAVENTVYRFDKLFTYAVPVSLQKRVVPGVRVEVPFGAGNRGRIGVVFSLTEEIGQQVKEIKAVLDREPVLSAEMLELVLWRTEREYRTLFEAVKLMIPAGLQFRLRNSYVLSPEFKNFDRECYTPVQWQLILLLRSAGKSVFSETISGKLGITEDSPDFSALLEQGIVCKVNTAASKIKDAVSKMVRPIPEFTGKLTPRQKDVYQTLLDVGEASEKELCYFTGVSSSVVKALTDKGAAEVFEYEVYRRPAHFDEAEEQPRAVQLSASQQEAFDGLLAEYRNQSGNRCALLYGVT